MQNTFKKTKVAETLQITRERFLQMLMNYKNEVCFTGCAFAHLVYHVDESQSRTVKGAKVLEKIVRTRVTIGASYENRINRDLVKQGEEANFKAQSMSGSTRINEWLVQSDKTQKFRLDAVVENNVTPLTVYFHNKQRISKEKAIELDLFMPSYFTEKQTSGRGNMSEDKDFHTITPGLEKILSITLNKTKFVIVD